MSRMFVPGPVDVDDEVLQAQARPMMPHRSKEFEAIFQEALEKAKQLFLTQNRVFIASSSGTGLQEAAIRNFVQRDVLSCVNGAFADRWYDVAISNGKQADKLDAAWDEPITPECIPANPEATDFHEFPFGNTVWGVIEFRHRFPPFFRVLSHMRP